MPIDKEEVKRRLLQRERELSDEIATFNEDARDSRPSDVEDPIDEVISSQAKAGSFAVSNMASETLLQVRAALQRLEQGDYGICVDCGRPIEEARLNAVPWTPYCRDDQEKHDREREQPGAFESAL
ncbi:MAG TPA: TraR/DksA family transcriptional regulator [Bryobacteraceae bacterium]|jgi:DnaK suppressor protein|nr:TraR/DksA family transcriptional regulator [Bryobacteraceae bacterium]